MFQVRVELELFAFIASVLLAAFFHLIQIDKFQLLGLLGAFDWFTSTRSVLILISKVKILNFYFFQKHSENQMSTNWVTWFNIYRVNVERAEVYQTPIKQS